MIAATDGGSLPGGSVKVAENAGGTAASGVLFGIGGAAWAGAGTCSGTSPCTWSSTQSWLRNTSGSPG